MPDAKGLWYPSLLSPKAPDSNLPSTIHYQRKYENHRTQLSSAGNNRRMIALSLIKPSSHTALSQHPTNSRRYWNQNHSPNSMLEHTRHPKTKRNYQNKREIVIRVIRIRVSMPLEQISVIEKPSISTCVNEICQGQYWT